ncbi:hypothetical protein [Nonomuraea sp. NPDC049758]|uniref:hypothetical protein n=1 Tax=Nonomuraea sp. NPDC049758 TaxID=3154360 RepID=UPI00342357EF
MRHSSPSPSGSVLSHVVTGLYGAVLTVAADVALVSGELGPLWGLTLFSAAAEGVTATGRNLLAGPVWTVLVLRAQGSDDRWGTATVAHDLAAPRRRPGPEATLGT